MVKTLKFVNYMIFFLSIFLVVKNVDGNDDTLQLTSSTRKQFFFHAFQFSLCNL